MQTLLILVPMDLATALAAEASERGLLVAELAGLILHEALLTGRDSDGLQAE